jgi:hypothetical protein
MLDIVEDLRSKKSSSAVFSFLKSVLAKSFPNPGEKLSVKTFETDTYELERSDNDYLLDIVRLLLAQTYIIRCHSKTCLS